MPMWILKLSIIFVYNATSSFADDMETTRSPTVAIFADYDSCFDILNPFVWDAESDAIEYSERFFAYHELADEARAARKLLQDYLAQITQGRQEVYLFVGSSRQSLKFDMAITKSAGTLSAIGGGGFEAIAKDTTWKKHQWKMNYALLADVGKKGASRWAKDTKGSAWIDASLRQPIETTINSSQMDDWRLKLMMIENNFLQLKKENGPVDVFFFDDKAENLDYTRAHARVPEHISFYTVHYDHLEYINGVRQPEAHPLVGRKAIPALAEAPESQSRDGKKSLESILSTRIWARLTGSAFPIGVVSQQSGNMIQWSQFSDAIVLHEGDLSQGMAPKLRRPIVRR